MHLINTYTVKLTIFEFICLYTIVRIAYIVKIKHKIPSKYIILQLAISLIFVVIILLNVTLNYYNATAEYLSLFALMLSAVFCSRRYFTDIGWPAIEVQKIRLSISMFIVEIIIITYLLKFIMSNYIK